MESPDLHRFLFAGLPVRGALVRISAPWREALARRATVGAFPAPVRDLLGEMVAAAVLMQSSIKFDGALVLQVHGDGPVKLAVAEVKTDLSFRTTAQVRGPIAPDDALTALVNVAGGGRCAIMLDPADRPPGAPPYQGVVPLHGDRREPLAALAQVLEHYMLQSEQLDTSLVLAADDRIAAGLMLQRMPQGASAEAAIGRDEDYRRLATVAATLTRAELLALDSETVLRRLFRDETLQRFAPRSTRFACSCSRERVQRMLIGLGRDEIEGLVAERGQVEVGCEFCGLMYRYDAVDVGAMFTPPIDAPDGPAALQ